MTDGILIGIIGILLLVILYLLYRLWTERRELRAFTKQLHEIREEGQNRLVLVDTFHKDICGLANEINQYTEQEQKSIKQAEEDRQHTRMVVAGISHDFRTPLTSAMGYMQMVRSSEELSGQNEEYLDIAIEKTRYLKELSDEFFALSVIENRREEDKQELSMRKVLENVTLGQYDWIQERKLSFQVQLTEDLCMMRAAEVDLIRLFENLYSNARKYAVNYLAAELRKSEGRIILSMENDTERNARLDTEAIFRPFERMEDTTAKGNGLGLYVAKRIVENYNGDIQAELPEDGVFRLKVILWSGE